MHVFETNHPDPRYFKENPFYDVSIALYYEKYDEYCIFGLSTNEGSVKFINFKFHDSLLK